MKVGFVLFFFFLFFSPLFWRGADVFAQDLHYTQYNASPQNLNPAQTGLFNGDWRFVGNYRTQWAGISVPFVSYSVAADTRLKQIKNSVPAFGLLVNTDKSGDSKLTVTQIFLSAAIIKKLNTDSTHFISIGIQPGFTTKKFNADALTYDKQYDGDNYNSSLSSGENFVGSNSISYFDGGGGVAYLWKKSNRTQLNIGASFFHINKPEQSFFNNGNIKLDIKTMISGVAEFPVTKKVDLLPTFLYQKQGDFNETLLGVMGKYFLRPVAGMTAAASLGFFYRSKDACNVVATIDYRSFTAGLSYDINLSKLREASNNRGGFEISLIYIFKKNVPYIAKKRVCPIYM